MSSNISNPFLIYGVSLLFFSQCWLAAPAQDSLPGLKVISRMKNYRAQVRDDSTKRMVELKSMIPRLVYDLRYASDNNFMGRRMYPPGTKVSFLRWPAAQALQQVEAELNRLGFGLKIFDAYRPYHVTVKFWELVKDERYVAHPGKGSNHNRGTAVDLTLIRADSGEELDMGTGFDHFSDTAHHGFTRLPDRVLQNRNLLRSLMEKHGFSRYENEWWHYAFRESARYDVLDIGFTKLGK
mgnify:CR=1 FL=1